jgi:hypothetical protein
MCTVNILYTKENYSVKEYILTIFVHRIVMYMYCKFVLFYYLTILRSAATTCIHMFNVDRSAFEIIFCNDLYES